jgi:F-type H+-transporting ATPase subunit gamma
VSRQRALEHRLRTLRTLGEAIEALRALSAQHFRSARARLPAARAYRDELDPLLAALGPAPADRDRDGPAGIVLFAADLGLVGDYTARLLREALELRRELGSGPLICVGGRAAAGLARADVRPHRTYPAPSSVAGLTGLLLPLVDEVLELHRLGALGALWLVAARFEGTGRFRPARVPLLPVVAPPGAPALRISVYCDPERLRRAVVREALYAALYETLLEALASEHGKRLVTAESARSWLDERIQQTQRRVSEVRRETSTQEILELVGGARASRREKTSGRMGAWGWRRPD